MKLKSKIYSLAHRLLMYRCSRANYKFVIKEWTSLYDLKSASEALRTMRFTRNLKPIVMPDAKGMRILVIAPHPDDEILGPGGCLIKSAASGAKIRTIYLTSGKEDMRVKVEKETQIVADKIGYETKFLRYPLGKIPISDVIMKAIHGELCNFKPDCLFIPNLFDDHDDHRRTNQIIYEMFESYGIPHKMEIWEYQVYTTLIPNVVVDITDEIGRKAEAVRLWSSQSESRDWVHYILGLNAFNVRFIDTNEPKYVEAFFVLPTNDFISLCKIYFAEPSKCYYHSYYRDGTD